jgi:signal transduction histidine kinase
MRVLPSWILPPRIVPSSSWRVRGLAKRWPAAGGLYPSINFSGRSIIGIMHQGRATEASSSAHVTELVSTALRQEKLAGICEMLRSIAQSCDADTCLLWRLAPGSDLKAQPPEGRLFVLAQWLKGDKLWASHNLSLNSVTGRGIIAGKPQCVLDIERDPHVARTDTFFERTGAKTFCTVPITFVDEQKGAINFYRNTPRPFRGQELAEANRLAALVPSLYQTIRDKVSSALLSSVSGILQTAERTAVDCPPPKDSMREVVQTICSLVGETFQSLETSIFFEDRVALPGEYELVATTWDGPFPKKSYTKEDPAITAWILANARPVKLFNLADFHDEREVSKIRKEYEGLTWSDSLEFERVVRQRFGQIEEGWLPPLSFVGAPILMGNTVLGAIRCCTAVRPPHYFADGELRLLELVAAQIAQYWSHWITRREAEEENRSWRTFVRRVSEMNHAVQKDLTGGELNEVRIFGEALELAESAIRGADILDIRLLDEPKQELYYFATRGAEWEAGGPGQSAARKAVRYPVDYGSPASIGAQVVGSGRTYMATDLTTDPLFHGRFPRTKRFIAVPVRSRDKIIGVLDIRGTGPSDFAKHAVPIAELLGQQLGLYNYLGSTILELRRTQKEQTETYQDLGHQLKSPIFQAQARIQSVLRSLPSDGPMTANFNAIRGLLGKAKRVAMGIRLFAQLAGKRVELSQSVPLRADDLIKTLIQYASDHRMLLGTERGVTFHVDPKGFEALRKNEVRLDYDLLEQAVNNVLDNAFKYSFPKTTVRIGGGITSTGWFHISVINEGIRLRASEIDKSKERGWRSEDAEATTGEGSGLGLWIVDHIMKAHKGELVVVPTTASNLTEVKLLFPVARSV